MLQVGKIIIIADTELIVANRSAHFFSLFLGT